jgi:hypothetical protein
MASDVDISNTALSLIGADAVVSSISPPDGSIESGHCARFYPLARKAMMELGDWSFVKTRVLLAEITNVSQIWTYAYASPADCINALRILRPDATTNSISMSDPFGSLYPQVPSYFIAIDESAGAPFELDGGVIRTNQPDATLIYSHDVVDTTKFPGSFVLALSYMLASYLAGPIIKGMTGIQIGKALRQEAMLMAAASSANEANNGLQVNEPVAAALRARA